MPSDDGGYHAPYIPNNDPQVRQEMLAEIGVDDVEELYSDIPEALRFDETLALPSAESEFQVRKHIESLLSKNKSTGEMLNFLGGGCWPHHVPALCDEIKGRSEFLTAYAGETYTDLGRYQAFFEAHSMLGDLIGLDAVGLSVYDWATAAGDATRMAAKITNRHEILVPEIIHPDRLSVIRNYCRPLADITLIGYDSETGQIDIDDLQDEISSATAGVYFENPSYSGIIEGNANAISEIAHDHGALSVVGVDPISLGVMAAPADYGADIVCGEGQPLGMHMNYGGGAMGILACRDEEPFISAIPTQLVTIAPTRDGDDFGFSWWALPERSMYHERGNTESLVGSSTALWTIASAVYLALLGPDIQRIGETIMQKSHYAKRQLSGINGIKTDVFDAPHFKEFVIKYVDSDVTVREVNEALRENGIQGGKNLSDELPELGESALFCVTEVHSQDDIHVLAETLAEVV